MRYKKVLTAAVCLMIMSTAAACGKSSARTVSPPPESTPAWVDADEIAESISERDEQLKAGIDKNNSNERKTADIQQNNSNRQAKGTDKNKENRLPDISVWKNTEPGWHERPEGWYYIGSSGQLVTGWTEVGQYTYYLDEETGILATEDIVDGAYVNKDGVRRELTEYEQQLLDTEGQESVLAYIAEASDRASKAAEAEALQSAGAESQAQAKQNTDAEAGGKAEAEEGQKQATEAAEKQTEAELKALQNAADYYEESGTADISGLTTRTVLTAAAGLTGAAEGSGISETEDCYVINGARVTAAQLVPEAEVEKLSAKDTLSVTCGDKEYNLIVLQTSTDSEGHKTVIFNDDLISLNYTDEGYAIETADGSTAGRTIYTGQLYIRKDAVIENAEGSSSAAEYIQKALGSGQPTISGSFETDGSGRIIKLSE